VRQSWSQGSGLMPPCCSAWLSAPLHWRGHPARPRSAHQPVSKSPVWRMETRIGRSGPNTWAEPRPKWS